MPYSVPDVDSADCPRSLLRQHPEVIEQLTSRNRIVKAYQAAGIQTFAPGEISARQLDVLLIIEDESNKVDYTRDQVERDSER